MKRMTAGILTAASLLGAPVARPKVEGLLESLGGDSRIVLPSWKDILAAGGGQIADLSGNLQLKNKNTVNGTTPTPSTTSTTYAVISGMTVTITTKGNKVYILFTGSVSTTAGGAQGAGVFAIFKDGVQLSNDFFLNTGGITNCSVLALGFMDSPTAASHTYDVRWKCGSAGQTTELQGTAYTLQVVELG